MSRKSEDACDDKDYEWEKPSWTKPKLRNTGKRDVLEKGGDLQGTITMVKKNHMDDINFEANASLLRATDKGTTVRTGATLAGPVTNINAAKDPLADINREADPNAVLKATEKGKHMKERGDLQAAITHVKKDHMDDIK